MNTDLKTRLILFLAAFVLYAQTIDFDYALDDKIVATNNQITKRGFSGMFTHFKHDAMDGFWAEEYGVPVEELNKNALVAGGRYRPLTLITHSIEWGLFKKAPGFSHFVNAVLYALLVMFVYLWLRRLLQEPRDGPFWKNTAFWAALLFAAHPLHTEVVANVKGRDEILSFLFAAAALYHAQKSFDNEQLGGMWKSAALFFLSYLSKETTVTFVAVWPAALWFFRKPQIKEIVKWSWQPALAAGVYLLIRSAVIASSGDGPGQLMNNPFLHADAAQKWATVTLTFAAYIKLIFWPWPLTHDYYPFHLPFTSADTQYAEWANLASVAGLVLIAALIIGALAGTVKRDKRYFGIALFLITFLPVSNVLFPVGVFMNERFMFIPSLGMILFILFMVRTPEALTAGRHKRVALISTLVVLAFSAVTVMRNEAWRDDSTLSLTDVETSVGSAKAQMSAGDALLSKLKKENNPDEKSKLISRCYEHLKKSLEIHPNYFPPHDLMGQLYFYAERYEESVKWFDRCAQMKPGRAQFVNNMVAGADKLKENEQFQASLDAYHRVLNSDPGNIRALENSAEIYARQFGDTDKALEYLERAVEADAQNATLYEKIGIVYAMRRDFEKAFRYFDTASELSPDNASIIKNKGITYMQLGREEEGRALLQKAEELEAKR